MGQVFGLKNLLGKLVPSAVCIIRILISTYDIFWFDSLGVLEVWDKDALGLGSSVSE